MLKYSTTDINKTESYILYDLFEKGLLNEKGISFLNTKIPDEILLEVGKTLNLTLSEIQQYSKVL